ncbi:YlbF family regulator [Metallumcola ferriviriculae]|uniref:UPF0342 protein MFMK1_001771 n=1 Tax=Metallumcola ferriviriculae TaxID=3039180 RepID=A0AAU0UP40_9FIRM|nr:YlbF family regulator [Desulfitibacteraceae bacterium MK1]
MDSYDKAQQLAKALANSEEYQQFTRAKEKVEEDESNMSLLQEFRRRQLELQMSQITGEEVDEEQVEQVEQMYQMLSLNKNINEYLNAEYRLSRLMSDIQKIIGDAVKDWFEFGERESSLN